MGPTAPVLCPYRLKIERLVVVVIHLLRLSVWLEDHVALLRVVGELVVGAAVGRREDVGWRQRLVVGEGVGGGEVEQVRGGGGYFEARRGNGWWDV